MRHITCHVRGDIIDRRNCPTCNAVVLQRYRPGRARVYCDNACRQRAYRWRRSHGIRICVERTGPTERGIVFGRSHALRDSRDAAAASLVDHRNRTLAVCGTFVRPARFNRFTHFDFLPGQRTSCKSCTGLVGAPEHPPTPIVPAIPSYPRPIDRPIDRA